MPVAQSNGGAESDLLATRPLSESEQRQMYHGGYPLVGIGGGDALVKAAVFVISSIYVIDKVGNPSFPGPWKTDRPTNYIPNSPTSPNNKNYFPNGNGNDFIKWTIRMGEQLH